MATDNFARILALKAKSAAEATSYSDLTNKPSINDVVLDGNLSLEDLGLNAIWVGTSAEYAEIASSLEDGTLVVITDDQDVDNVPTQSSTNLVYSGGVYAFVTQGLSDKVDKETGKGLSAEDYTTAEKTKLAGLTNDYTNHINKPQINGVTLVGDKSLSDLGINFATTETAGIVKPDGVSITVAADGTISAAQIDVGSWYGVRDIVEQGLANRFFRVGDQLACMRSDEKLIWDIVDIAADGTAITLLLHETMPDLVFDAKEAVFVFPDGLAAGEYHFTVTDQPWFAGDIGKTISFTLTQAIPEGGQLLLNNAYNATMIGATISSFASPTATPATETVTMAEGSGGTDLGSLTNAGTPASNINSIQRALLGSNNWRESAQRQMINSDKPSGSVWTPQTIFDRPPNWASNTAGFMYGLDEDFVSVVSPTKYTTINNTVSAVGGEYTLTDKFYLPSRTEIFGTNELTNYPEGNQFAYYVGATDADRIKYQAGSARSWRLRTPNSSNAYRVRYVSTTGAINVSNPTIALGWSPACRIAKS